MNPISFFNWIRGPSCSFGKKHMLTLFCICSVYPSGRMPIAGWGVDLKYMSVLGQNMSLIKAFWLLVVFL